MNILVSLLLVFLSLSMARAQTFEYDKFGIDSSSIGQIQSLEIGEKAPEFLIEGVSLSKVLEDGPVVLFFYRGHWCGYCTRYIAALEEAMGDLTKKGYQVVGVVPQKEEYIDKAKEDTKASFPIIADSDLSIMKAYKVAFNVTDAYSEKVERYTKLTLSEMNGEEVLPIPATYVIGQDGTIQWVHYTTDYSERASVQSILDLEN